MKTTPPNKLEILITKKLIKLSSNQAKKSKRFRQIKEFSINCQ